MDPESFTRVGPKFKRVFLVINFGSLPIFLRNLHLVEKAGSPLPRGRNVILLVFHWQANDGVVFQGSGPPVLHMGQPKSL